MSKKNSKSKHRQDKTQPTISPVILPAEMSQEEMQHVIANAILETKNAEDEAKRKQKEANIQELQQAIGFKEFNDRNIFLRSIKTMVNRIKCAFRICFLPRKYIEGDRFTFGILSMLLTLIFAFVAVVLYIVAALFFVCGIIALIRGQSVPLWGIEWYNFLPSSLTAFFFASTFRISSIEIEKVEDRNYIQSLLNIVLAIIAAIIAYLSLIKE